MFLSKLKEKTDDLEKAYINEKLYYNTMPYSIYEAKKERDELNTEKLMKLEQNIVLSFNTKGGSVLS